MSIMTEKSIECNSSVSDSPGSPIATFRDYAENIKRYIRTGSYASGYPDTWPTPIWPTDIWPISALGDIWPTDNFSLNLILGGVLS